MGAFFTDAVLPLKDVADIATERDDLCGQQHAHSECVPLPCAGGPVRAVARWW